MRQNVDALTYKKGQATLGMFERFVGPETFRKGVLAYMKKRERVVFWQGEQICSWYTRVVGTN